MNVRLGNEGELYHGPERTQMSVKAAEEARPRKQLSRSRQWGRVEVLPTVVAAIAAHAATGCYGVHGMDRFDEGTARRGYADRVH